jgi:hypothetical protein
MRKQIIHENDRTLSPEEMGEKEAKDSGRSRELSDQSGDAN